MGGRRSALACVVLVGVAYLLGELVLFSLDRAISWDEAVYLSQVTPGMRALPFVASRARGITLLAWPIAQLGGALPTVRIVLAASSATALVAAYCLWVPVIGFGAPIAAVVFGSTWIGLLYGSEVMPNLWAALLAVSSMGALARMLAGQTTKRWELPLAAVLLALLSLFRPPDAIPVILAIAAVALWTKVALSRIAWLTAGVIVGWIPWVVEMTTRFGGPLEALRQAQQAAHVSTASVGSRFVQHLAVLNGPTIGPLDDPHIPIGGLVWWGALLALAVLGVIRARQSPMFPALFASTLAGFGLAAEYLLLVDGIAPRFLLPAYALLSLPAASALCRLYTGLRFRGLARGVLLVVLIGPWIIWQLGTANRIEAQTDMSRRSLEEVGLFLREAAAGRPCSFASTDGFPQIEYASGCDGRQLGHEPSRQIAYLAQAAAGDSRAFLVGHMASTPRPNLPTRVLLTLPAPRGRKWFIEEVLPDTDPVLSIQSLEDA